MLLEPVNASTSWPPSKPGRARALPETSERAPSGSALDSMKHLEQAVRHQGRRGCGLGNNRHSREKRASGFFGESPGWEVEGVDVDRNSSPRRQDVLRGESCGSTDLKGFAVGEPRAITQGLPKLGIVGEGETCTINVEFRIAPGIAAVGDRERDELLATGVQ